MPREPGANHPVPPEEAARTLKDLPRWIVDRDRLHRDYRFGNFQEAMAFANRVAEMAERLQHHPNIRIHEWCFVELELYSHEHAGLSAWDVDFARALADEPDAG